MCQIGPDKDFTKHFGCDYFLPRFISFICAIHGDNSKQYLHRMDHNEGCKIQSSTILLRVIFSLLQSTDWLWNKQWKTSIINSSSNTCTWWLWDTYNIYNKISKQCTFIWIIHCHNKNKIHTKMYNSYKKCIKRYLKVYSSFEHNVVLNIFAGDNLWNRKSIIQKIAHIAFDQRNECHNQLILKLKVHEHLGCFLKIKLRSRFHLIKAPCILDNYNKSNHHIKS